MRDDGYYVDCPASMEAVLELEEDGWDGACPLCGKTHLLHRSEAHWLSAAVPESSE